MSGGSFFCYQNPCDWPTEYCDGEVQRDENQDLWGCLGDCKPRKMKYYSENKCNTSTIADRASYDTDDGNLYYVGAQIYPEVYFIESGGAWNIRPFWNSEAEIHATLAEQYGDGYMQVPFNNDAGVGNATVRYLTLFHLAHRSLGGTTLLCRSCTL